ncbi:unnamed protein product [Diabrotica balteata]|uniref:Transposase n=1 Tax=Diabrotica balteata TaxID=107213 RepID=A0A9N9SZQ6_DIABA|nr:unnamed protein product [Diabrotica balteata]
MVLKVKARLKRNPRSSGNQMVTELKISQRSMQRILKKELKVKPYKFQKAHNLAPKQKKVQLERAKEFLCLRERGEFPNIVFSDKKTFPIEQFINSQNDRVYLTERTYKSLSLRAATRNSLQMNKYSPKGIARLIFVELMLSVTKFCKRYNYNLEKSGALLSQFYLTHVLTTSSSDRSTEKVYNYFKELALAHTLPDVSW